MERFGGGLAMENRVHSEGRWQRVEGSIQFFYKGIGEIEQAQRTKEINLFLQESHNSAPGTAFGRLKALAPAFRILYGCPLRSPIYRSSARKFFGCPEPALEKLNNQQPCVSTVRYTCSFLGCYSNSWSSERVQNLSKAKLNIWAHETWFGHPKSLETSVSRGFVIPSPFLLLFGTKTALTRPDTLQTCRSVISTAPRPVTKHWNNKW